MKSISDQRIERKLAKRKRKLKQISNIAKKGGERMKKYCPSCLCPIDNKKEICPFCGKSYPPKKEELYICPNCGQRKAKRFEEDKVKCEECSWITDLYEALKKEQPKQEIEKLNLSIAAGLKEEDAVVLKISEYRKIIDKINEIISKMKEGR